MHITNQTAEAPYTLQSVCAAHPQLIEDHSEPHATRLSLLIGCIVIGSGIYGASIGLWRSPLQAFYTLIKFPLLILLTCAGTSLLNWMLSSLVGAKLSFKEIARAMLLSYALISLILGALSPISFFMLYNTPPLEIGVDSTAYSFTLLSHVVAIAFAGLISNSRLQRTLTSLTASKALAQRLLLCWMLSHLLLGSQLSWNLRPFIGSPLLEVQFVRPDAFTGSFFEAVHRSALKLYDTTPEREDHE